MDQKIFLKYKEASGGKEPDDESSTVINGATYIGSKLSTVINGATNISSEVPPKMTQVEATGPGNDILLFKHTIIENKFITESP